MPAKVSVRLPCWRSRLDPDGNHGRDHSRTRSGPDFRRLHIRDTIKVLVILGMSFLMVSLQDSISPFVPFSGLLAVMTLGGTILKSYEVLARRISGKFSKIWVAAELVLFDLVGAEVDIRYAAGAGLAVVAILISAPLGAIGIEKTYHRLLERA